MFYSQFILAKKGPLGTIWIAAHLERKLRKNQVADTDIGVSVDSILFPEVPIALRLSSHLLLGVVRIYSRKVNYLFDDCSEALLKIKQAFRSTAVDLPPEESTAPYHSITLPETFDLDDFELPDNEIFQGNYVDHHISTKEQITLQDTMEGVVYSTSQFGLDERFGDGDTSQIGLDLEDLFLEKVAAPRHVGVMLDSDADPRASVQPMTPLEKDENSVGMTETSEVMPANGSGKQLESLAANSEFIESAQAPSTPGLVEEPNLSNVQKALACDDHLESEDHNSTELEAIENIGNDSSKSDHHGDKNAVDWSLLNNMNSDCMPVEENGHIMGDQEIMQAKPQGDLPSTSETVEHILSGNPSSPSSPSLVLAEHVKPISMVSNCPGRIIAVSDDAVRAEDLQNGVLSNNEPSIPSIGQAHSECVEPQGVGLDETVASPSFPHGASDLEDACHKQSSGVKHIPEKSSINGTFQPVSGGIPENDQALLKPGISNSMEITRNVEESSSPRIALVSNVVCPLESPGGTELENVEAQTCHEPKDHEILNPNEEMPSPCIHVLQACNSHLNQADKLLLGGDNSVAVPDLPSEVVGPCSLETSGREEAQHASGASTEVQGEGCRATDVVKSTLEVNQMSELSSCEDIQADHSKLDGQLNIAKDTGENSNSFAMCDLPAPEKLLSAPEGPTNLPNDLLMESTPDKEVPVEGDGIKLISGKKRSFTESALTLQSLNSVESVGKARFERTAESVPDDDDLLSSILVGRRSSILKMKPTPPPPDVVSMKRPRTAPRVSASKRKVLMDDTMVLHGDTIRQQLTNTEDIRRVRKKAPCTRPEIWMIQKQFLEDEIFSEPLSTGMSTEFICLHNQTYDMSRIRVSQNDENIALSEVAKDIEFSVRPNIISETETEGNTEPLVVRSEEEAQPAESLARNEVQQGEDSALGFHDNDYDAQVQMKATTTTPELRTSSHELSGEISEMEIGRGSFAVADAAEHAVTFGVESLSPTDPVSGDIYNMSAGSMVHSALLDKTSGTDPSLQMDGSCLSPDQKLDSQSVEKYASVVDLSNGKGVDPIEVPEIHHYFAPTDSADPSLATVSPETGGCNDLVVVTDDQAMEETTKNELGVVNEDQVLAAELGYDDKDPTSNRMCSEGRQPDCSYSVKLDVDMKNVSLNDGENASLNEIEKPGFQEAELRGVVDAETTALDSAAFEDRGDLENVIVGHDTEFLNVDDDEVAEEDDDCMPSAEETRILDNSGWSSRTRAVAKYLQTLFDKEAERGRKVIPMENLLAGKTRKEASRMFFETLVLKTRDYIQVEQENPFDNVNIKPRVKLMKSDF